MITNIRKCDNRKRMVFPNIIKFLSVNTIYDALNNKQKMQIKSHESFSILKLLNGIVLRAKIYNI